MIGLVCCRLYGCVSSLMKLGSLQNLRCAFQNPILPMCMYKLHVGTSKNVAFLVTELIYNKTGLFRIISV